MTVARMLLLQAALVIAIIFVTSAQAQQPPANLAPTNLAAERNENGNVQLTWDWPTGCETYYPIGDTSDTFTVEGCAGKRITITRNDIVIYLGRGILTSFLDVGAHTHYGYQYRVTLADLPAGSTGITTNTDPNATHQATVLIQQAPELTRSTSEAPQTLKANTLRYRRLATWGRVQIDWSAVHDAPAYIVKVRVLSGRIRGTGDDPDLTGNTQEGEEYITVFAAGVIHGTLGPAASRMTLQMQEGTYEASVATCSRDCSYNDYGSPTWRTLEFTVRKQN